MPIRSSGRGAPGKTTQNKTVKTTETPLLFLSFFSFFLFELHRHDKKPQKHIKTARVFAFACTHYSTLPPPEAAHRSVASHRISASLRLAGAFEMGKKTKRTEPKQVLSAPSKTPRLTCWDWETGTALVDDGGDDTAWCFADEALSRVKISGDLAALLGEMLGQVGACVTTAVWTVRIAPLVSARLSSRLTPSGRPYAELREIDATASGFRDDGLLGSYVSVARNRDALRASCEQALRPCVTRVRAARFWDRPPSE